MSKDMQYGDDQSQGNNGASSITTMNPNTDWDPNVSGQTMLLLNATNPLLEFWGDVTALQCFGDRAAPGMVGCGGAGPGVVGVSGCTPPPAPPALPPPPPGIGKHAGVFGTSLNRDDPGVLGEGQTDGVVGVADHHGVVGLGNTTMPPIGARLSAGVLGAGQRLGVVGVADLHGVVGVLPNATIPIESDIPAGVLGSGYLEGEGEQSALGVLGVSNKEAGVAGLSDNGPGVLGVCKSIEGVGVHGVSSLSGVWGESDAGRGVEGDSKTGPGVFGSSDSNYGVIGQSTAMIGVRGSAPIAGVVGQSTSGVGVLGTVTGPGGNGIGVFGNSWTPNGFMGTAGFFWGPVFVIGPFTVIGAGNKHAAVPHPDDSTRLLYSMESPESWFEDFGEGKLVNGKAEVKLDPDFAALVRTDRYHVFVTPYGDSHGLYVAKRTDTGFEVREQQGGKSSVEFSYRVVAKPTDIEGERLKKVTLPPVPSELLQEMELPSQKLPQKKPELRRHLLAHRQSGKK